MGKITDLSGNRYGNLIVLSFNHKTGNRYFWKCKCKCGNETVVRGDTLSKRLSCGCSQITHGESVGSRKTKEYEAWGGIKARCNNPKHKRYRYYGAKGVRVCDRWVMSFDNFLCDMGRAPSIKHSLDRIDVNGDYEPGNCRWATQKEQMNNTTTNRMITIKETTKNLTQWCEALNLDYKKIHNRLQKGWTEERAITQK